MFAVADLIVMNAIEEGLENLRNNPSHLEFILGKYDDTPYMRNLHGSSYVRQCKELVLQNKIFVKPYYVLDLNKLPSVAVIAQYSEDLLMLGDYGADCQSAVIPPVLLGRVLGIAWESTGYGLEIANAEEVTKWIYAGSYLKQDGFISKIDRIMPSDDGKTATIYCVDLIRRNRLIDWEIVTAEGARMAIIHTSGNTANVSIDLKSSGDIETHKLLALVIRYCLKHGRYIMDDNGLQITTSSQNFPSPFDVDQGIFQTVFSLQGKILDHWVQSEKNNPQGIFLDIVPEH